jgi:hypothetical protein
MHIDACSLLRSHLANSRKPGMGVHADRQLQ